MLYQGRPTGTPPKPVPETDLNNDIGLDSLQMIQFMLKVEDQLNVVIDYDQFDYEHLQSIDTFITFLKANRRSDLCTKMSNHEPGVIPKIVMGTFDPETRWRDPALPGARDAR